MKKILAGLIAGILLTGLILFYSSPSLFFLENKSKYDFETTIEEFKKSVADAGWKIPHVNNLQATLDKFGYDVHKVMVFEVCQPDHANNILSHDDERIVSSLMPCRVAIYEKSDGMVYISRLNSGMMAKPMNKIIRSTMRDASRETEEILKSVIGNS